MTTSDDDVRPFPDHVTPGGAPDPVVATAPVADAAHDDLDPVDEMLEKDGAPIYPVAGAQAGAIPPPSLPH